MIYFTLPQMVNNYKLNNFLIKLNHDKPEYFNFPITFFSTNGNFNFTLWNGDLNNNSGEFLTYQKLMISNKYNIPIRFNCANTYIKQLDYFDEYMNIILKLNENENNYIEIADFKLMDYIKNTYPKYQFILSNTMHLYNEFTVNFLNTISKFDEFSLIQLPINYPNLMELENKNKYELIINPLCDFNCKQYKKCYNMEQLNQINYSEEKNIHNCNKIQTQIINPLPFIKNGFNFFSFTQYNYKPEIYIKFFIKEEYQEQVIEEYKND